jgi:hypothetical protein
MDPEGARFELAICVSLSFDGCRKSVVSPSNRKTCATGARRAWLDRTITRAEPPGGRGANRLVDTTRVHETGIANRNCQ